MKRLLVKGQWIDLPDGCSCNGPSEVLGKRLLHFTDHSTGSDFTVYEKDADTTTIHLRQQQHRARFAAAGPAFAPPPL